MKKAWKKVFSLVLSLSMVLALVPVTAMADGEGEGSEPPIVNDGGEPGETGEGSGDGTGEPSNTEEDNTEEDNTEVSDIYISNAEQLIDAIKNQEDGQTWILADGEYNIGDALVEEEFTINNKDKGFVFPITANNLKITAAAGADVTITSTYDPNSGNWHAQNFITIKGEGVTIENVNLKGNKNSAFGCCNKVIELIDGAKDFTLRNVELLPLEVEDEEVEGVNSGSIYVNVEDAGTVTLEDVTMYSWVNAGKVENGEVIADGLVQDFTDNAYAGYFDEDNGYAWTPGISGNDENVTIKDFTIKVDDNTRIDEQVFNDKLKAGTTVVLEEGTYEVSKCIVIGKDVVIEGNGSTIQLDTDVTNAGNGKCNVFELEGGAEIEINDLTIDGGNGEEGYNAKHGVNVFTAPSDEGRTTVTLNNVTIENCKGYGVVSNASNLTVEDITTKDNGWGGINVDNSSSSKDGGSTFTMVSGELNEVNSLCIENAQKESIEATIEDGTMNNIILQNVDESDDVSLTIKDGTFGSVAEVTKADDGQPTVNSDKTGMIVVKGGEYGDSVADYAKNAGNTAELNSDGTYTYYPTVEDAQKVAQGGDKITDNSTENATPVTQVKVTFVLNNGENDVVKVVSKGQTVEVPSVSRSGYRLLGWVVGSAYITSPYTVPDDFDGTEITIEAAWKKKSSSPSSSSSSSSTKTYAVSPADDMENGKVTVSPSKAEKGDKVTITVTPDKGYEINKVTAKDANGDKIDLKDNGDGKYTFTMPASKVEVKATFSKAAETPVVEEVKPIILTINQKIANLFGELMVTDVAPIIRNERTMLPIRLIAENLGATVAWDGTQNKVTITKDELTIEIFIGQPFALVNGTPVELDAPAFIENDRTYLPLRFVAENLGASVTWNAETQEVTIFPAK